MGYGNLTFAPSESSNYSKHGFSWSKPGGTPGPPTHQTSNNCPATSPALHGNFNLLRYETVSQYRVFYCEATAVFRAGDGFGAVRGFSSGLLNLS